MSDLDNDKQILPVSRLPECDTRLSSSSYDITRKQGVGQKCFLLNQVFRVIYQL